MALAFWDAWFKPKCDACGERITDEPADMEGRALHPACLEELVAAAEAEARDVEERRRMEAEALQALENREWRRTPTGRPAPRRNGNTD